MKKLYGALYTWLHRVDGLYLAACLGCSLFSALMLASLGYGQLGNYDKALTQLAATGLGLACAVALSCMDYRVLVKKWYWHAPLAWAAVLPTLLWHNLRIGRLVVGYDAGGTSNYSWYKLGEVSFQPSELAKVSFLLTFALHLSWAGPRLNRPRRLLPVVAHLLLPVLLIHCQGDDGTALVFLCMGCTMLFMAGLSWKYIAALLGAGALAVGMALALFGERLLKSYQLARVMAVLYPADEAYADYAYQQNRAVISIGSGRIFGRGLLGGPYTSVPNVWNDFIFSYICESIGFVGGAAVLLVLALITIKTLRIGLHSADQPGALLCGGAFAALFAQILINLGMNLQLSPVIGVTLPFLSAGGSSTLMLYLCVGLVLSVERFSRPLRFDPGKEV